MYTLQIVEQSKGFYECKLLNQIEDKNVTLDYFKLYGKWDTYRDLYNEHKKSFILQGTRYTAIQEFKHILNIDTHTKCIIKTKENSVSITGLGLRFADKEQLKDIMGW